LRSTQPQQTQPLPIAVGIAAPNGPTLTVVTLTYLRRAWADRAAIAYRRWLKRLGMSFGTP
jgi:hypothetical protein